MRIDHCFFRPTVNEVLRISHEKLIQGVLTGNQDQGGILPAAPYPAAALPGGYHRPGISNQNTQIQISDIDTQLEGAGGDDGQKITL